MRYLDNGHLKITITLTLSLNVTVTLNLTTALTLSDLNMHNLDKGNLDIVLGFGQK